MVTNGKIKCREMTRKTNNDALLLLTFCCAAKTSSDKATYLRSYRYPGGITDEIMGQHHLIACCTRMSPISFRHPPLTPYPSPTLSQTQGRESLGPLGGGGRKGELHGVAWLVSESRWSQSRRSTGGAEGQDHQKAPGPVALPDDNDLEALEGQLNEVLNIAPASLAPERWASLRAWVERAVEAARSPMT